MTKPNELKPRQMKPTRFTWGVRYEPSLGVSHGCCIYMQRTPAQQTWRLSRCLDMESLRAAKNPRLQLAHLLKDMREEIRCYVSKLRNREAATR